MASPLRGLPWPGCWRSADMTEAIVITVVVLIVLKYLLDWF